MRGIEHLSVDHPSTILVNKMISMAEHMKSKYVDQPPCTITDPDEIMAVVWSAGIAIEFDFENNSGGCKMIIRTKNPIGVIWDGKKFVLHEQRLG